MDILTAPPTPVSEADRRRIVIGVLICMLLAALDQTIVAPVIPVMSATLGGADYISWIVSGYFLTATAVTPLYGKLADIYGRRPTILTAVAIFVAGSVLCALSPNMPLLVLGRAVQGLGGGGLMALAQTVIADLFPPKERGRLAGYIAIMWGTASIGGPVLGGVIAERFHWSLIFWLNLPLAAFAVLMSSEALKRLPWQRRHHKLDWIGAALVVMATLMPLLALALGPQAQFGWHSPIVLGLVATGACLATLTVQHLRRAPEPLIPLHVLGNRVVLFATSSVFLAMASNIGLSVLVPLFLELSHGRTAEQAGFALVGYMLGTVAGANTAGAMTARVENYKRIPQIGLIVASAVLAWIALRVGSIGLVELECALVIVGMGSGCQFPVTTVAVQNAVDPRDIGVATGVLSFMRALGSSIGIAAVGAVAAVSGIVINAMAEGGGVAHPVAAANFAPVFWVASMALAAAAVLFWQIPMLKLRSK